MPIRKQLIPVQNEDFYFWQANFVNRVVLNQVAWGLPAAAVTALVVRRAEYEPLFIKVKNTDTRTKTDVIAHNEKREIYENELRVFVRNYCGPLANTDKSDLGLTIRDLEPTPRGQITDIPYIKVKPVGGGDIEVRARTDEDKTMASMHELADAVECRWLLVPKGEMPPEDPDGCPKQQVSPKARFTISCGVKNAGDSFYGFFRWVNLTNPAHNGKWTTKALGAVIA